MDAEVSSRASKTTTAKVVGDVVVVWVEKRDGEGV